MTSGSAKRNCTTAEIPQTANRPKRDTLVTRRSHSKGYKRDSLHCVRKNDPKRSSSFSRSQNPGSPLRGLCRLEDLRRTSLRDLSLISLVRAPALKFRPKGIERAGVKEGDTLPEKLSVVGILSYRRVVRVPLHRDTTPVLLASLQTYVGHKDGIVSPSFSSGYGNLYNEVPGLGTLKRVDELPLESLNESFRLKETEKRRSLNRLNPPMKQMEKESQKRVRLVSSGLPLSFGYIIS